MLKVLVIGGGFAGCCASHLLTKHTNWDVTLIEQESFLGGGCKTHYYGGHPFTYGPRHFLTPDEKLFEFLNQFVPLRKIPEHEFFTYIETDAAFYQYPIHKDDIPRMKEKEQIMREIAESQGVDGVTNFEEYWIRSVGKTLYNKFINTYTKKMWKIESNTEFDLFNWSPKGVALKEGNKAAWSEAISAFPIAQNGYDDYFSIATRNTKVHLNTIIQEYDVENLRVKINSQWQSYDLIVSSTYPELLMNNAYGELRWIGRDFLNIVLPIKEVFPHDVYFLYYANNEPFTRIVDYKKFYRNKSDATLLGLEIPSFNNKLYPYPMKKELTKAELYLSNLPKNVFSIGRAGSYKYFDVDDIIAQCFELVEKVV